MKTNHPKKPLFVTELKKMPLFFIPGGPSVITFGSM